jgi:hypothetical protein
MIRLIDDWRTSHKKATVIFCAFMGVLAQYYTDVLSFAYHELPIIAQHMPAEAGLGKWIPWIVIFLRIVSFKKDKLNVSVNK